jgi:uncharacterized protein YxjI
LRLRWTAVAIIRCAFRFGFLILLAGPIAMLDRTEFLIQERVAWVKLVDVYDILDPETQVKIGEAREEVHPVIRYMRLLINKQLMPTQINAYELHEDGTETLLFSIRRGVIVFRPTIEVRDGTGTLLGSFRGKAFSLGGAFRVMNADGKEVAAVKGDWKGWNFRFLAGEQELGVVTKKWGGLAKEMFTSADKYLVKIHDSRSAALSLLLLAAGLAVDCIYKETK